ncbi:unnamed protein product [Cylindrotheca closterium]|uniref:Uncharacterized protein n=1 Tax=Cylindrotheca closterium TaxID=2856 RepID=A0AAD2FFD0_9STRA|nr:unnamed protein product [Cylindrotheca closterium]
MSSHSQGRENRKAARNSTRPQQEASQMNVPSSHSGQTFADDDSIDLTALGAQDVSGTGTVTRLASTIRKNQQHISRSRNPSRNNSIDTEEPAIRLPTSLYESHQTGASDDTVPSLFGSSQRADAAVPTLEATAAPDMDEEIERAR